MEDFVEKKAALILGGDVRIPEGYSNPLFECRDGIAHSMVLTFGPCRIRKRISDKGEFFLRPVGDGFVLEKGGEVFLDGVGLKQMFCHSPDLAVINLAKEDNVLSTDDALALLRKYDSEMDLKGITLHGSEPCTKEHYLEVVEAFHTEFPDLPIGVGLSDSSEEEMRRFLDTGARNVKCAVASPVGRIASGQEPPIDLAERKAYLGKLVSVFGKNNVVCTFHIGIGETDGEFLKAIDEFCAIGVMPDVKVMKRRGKNKDVPGIEDVTPERYVRVMRKVKDIMSDHGLDPSGYETMCYGCRCCNIVPFKDF